MSDLPKGSQSGEILTGGKISREVLHHTVLGQCGPDLAIFSAGRMISENLPSHKDGRAGRQKQNPQIGTTLVNNSLTGPGDDEPS